MSDTGVSEVGWIAVPRQVFSDAFFRREPFTEREAWIWLVADASWRPRTRRIENYVVDLERGQLLASARYLETAWQWRPGRPYRFLKRLESATRIKINVATGITVITICNYDEFQFSQSDFAKAHVPPDATAPQHPRKPRDIRRLDEWAKRGWSPSLCVEKIQHDLAKGLQKGSPVRSLHYSEPGLEELHAKLEEARRNRLAAEGDRS